MKGNFPKFNQNDKEKGKNSLFRPDFSNAELSFRKKLSKEFTKTIEDFPSEKEFNEYLETIEDFIFDLASGKDEKETWIKINNFRELHHSNKSKKQQFEDDEQEQEQEKQPELEQINQIQNSSVTKQQPQNSNSVNIQSLAQISLQSRPSQMKSIPNYGKNFGNKERIAKMKALGGWDDTWYIRRAHELAFDI